MQGFVDRFMSLAADDDGAALVEYAVLLALVALVAFVGLHKFGNKLVSLLQTIGKDVKIKKS